MASVDMCKHDWSGSGCDECKREAMINREVQRLERELDASPSEIRRALSNLVAWLVAEARG